MTLTVVKHPAVVSIARDGSETTNADSVSYTVTFSEAVTGVGAGDFALEADGLTGASIASVSGSGDTYMVTVDTGKGEGRWD